MKIVLLLLVVLTSQIHSESYDSLYSKINDSFFRKNVTELKEYDKYINVSKLNSRDSKKYLKLKIYIQTIFGRSDEFNKLTKSYSTLFQNDTELLLSIAVVKSWYSQYDVNDYIRTVDNILLKKNKLFSDIAILCYINNIVDYPKDLRVEKAINSFKFSHEQRTLIDSYNNTEQHILIVNPPLDFVSYYKLLIDQDDNPNWWE